MYNDMVNTCNASGDSADVKQRCLTWASRYHTGLEWFGGSAFNDRQNTVCNCEGRSPAGSGGGVGVDWSRKACCFVGQVPVATTAGLKAIDSITAGELVLAHNTENGQSEYRPVLEVQIHDGIFPLLDLELSGETIAVTTRHRFGLAGGRWLSSELIQPQSALQSAHSLALVSQTSLPESWQGLVYNLKVEGGNYYVGQNLVLVRDH
jgi:hypothetical protein